MNQHQRAIDILNNFAPRELDILRLLSEGLSNTQIAERLFFTLQTVKWYNRRIYEKLNVKNRTQASNLVIELDLFNSAHRQPISRQNDHLPRFLTSFVGRSQEIAALQALLAKSRFVAISGAGGSGKTRLSVEVARRVAYNYPDGAYFVSLAHLSDPAMVAPTIAQALGLGASHAKAPDALLCDFLRDKNMLLVVDNFEHLCAASPLLSQLVDAAPGLNLLVTSRETLCIGAEAEFILGPIALPYLTANPDPDVLIQSEAVILFIERMLVGPPNTSLAPADIKIIAQICVRLDGLPLAIELAAARHRLLGLPEMLRLLSNRLNLLKGGPHNLPTRQQTLRATIDWSYERLSADEKVLFANLSVFRGGCSRAAIQSVCQHGLSEGFSIIAGLTSLVDKNLLIFRYEGDGRFWMLATLREYGLERLAAENRLDAVLARHAEYYADFGGMRELSDQGTHRLGLEHANFRAAVEWSLENDRIELAARMISATAWRWNMLPSISEWYQLSERVIQHSASLTPKLRALLYNAVGVYFAYYCKRPDRARVLVEDAVHSLRHVGTKSELASALVGLSAVTDEVAYAEESLAIFTELNDLVNMAWAHNNIGGFARTHGDYEQAKRHFEAGLTLADWSGFHKIRALLRGSLGLTLLHLQQVDRAEHMFTEALSITYQNNDALMCVFAAAGFACVSVAKGDFERAAVVFGAVEHMNSLLGVTFDTIDEGFMSDYMDVLRQHLPADELATAWEYGMTMGLDDCCKIFPMLKCNT